MSRRLIYIPPFNPAAISGLLTWLDASDAATVTLNSGNVSQWTDKALGVNFVQATAINQPAYAVAAQRGLNAVQFTGLPLSGQYLTGTTIGSSQPVTIFVAANIQGNDPTNATDYIFDCVSGDPRITFATNLTGTDQNEMFLYAGGPNALDVTINKTDYTDWRQFTAVYNTSGSSSLSKDGTTLLSSNGLGNDQFVSMTIGARFSIEAFLNGYIGEILVYIGVLSANDRANVEAYLRGKWSNH